MGRDGVRKWAVRIVADQLPAPQAQGVLGQCAAVLTMRLHPAIFALNTRTPFVAVAYDRKVRAFMDQIDCADACISLREMNGPTLHARARAALDGKIASPEKLAVMHRRQLERAPEAGRLLRRSLGI